MVVERLAEERGGEGEGRDRGGLADKVSGGGREGLAAKGSGGSKGRVYYFPPPPLLRINICSVYNTVAIVKQILKS